MTQPRECLRGIAVRPVGAWAKVRVHAAMRWREGRVVSAGSREGRSGRPNGQREQSAAAAAVAHGLVAVGASQQQKTKHRRNSLNNSKHV